MTRKTSSFAFSTDFRLSLPQMIVIILRNNQIIRDLLSHHRRKSSREQGTNEYSSRKKKKKKKKKKQNRASSPRERERVLVSPRIFFSCISFLVGWGKSVLSFGSELDLAFPSARLSETFQDISTSSSPKTQREREREFSLLSRIFFSCISFLVGGWGKVFSRSAQKYKDNFFVIKASRFHPRDFQKLQNKGI